MLDWSCIVLARGKNLDIKVLVHSFHEVIVHLGKACNQYLAFPLSEKGNKRSLTTSCSTNLIRIM
jgi:hypothetical protein